MYTERCFGFKILNVRILFVIPSLGKGGAERVAVNLAKGLHSKGYEVSFCTFEEEYFYHLPHGIKVYSLNISGTNNVFLKLRNLAKRRLLLKEVKREKKIDISVSFLENGNIANLYADAKEVKIATVHNTTFSFSDSGPLSSVRKYFIKNTYKRADKIVCVSKGVKDAVIRLDPNFIDTTEVIYNPFEIQRIRDMSNEPILSFEESIFYKNRVLLNVGRLTQQKGQWHLLKLLSKLKKLTSEFKLVFLGEGPMLKELINFGKSLGLKVFYQHSHSRKTDNYDVFFLGAKKNPYKYFKRSFLFLFSSLWEGFGNVLVESLAVGLPIVSSDCQSGPREILAPYSDSSSVGKGIEFAEFGVLIEPFKMEIDSKENDKIVDLWKTAVLKLFEDENLYKRYVMKAENRANDFDLEKILTRWTGLFESSLAVS